MFRKRCLKGGYQSFISELARQKNTPLYVYRDIPIETTLTG